VVVVLVGIVVDVVVVVGVDVVGASVVVGGVSVVVTPAALSTTTVVPGGTLGGSPARDWTVELHAVANRARPPISDPTRVTATHRRYRPDHDL
jgi:hypothetical protein